MNNKLFTKESLEEAMKTLKMLSPVAIKIEVFEDVYNKIMDNINNISVLDNLKQEEMYKQFGYINSPYGLQIIGVKDSEEMKLNQGKVTYNDGTTKIIDLA